MLSKTPPMGFNTWNTFGENINEQIIKETADKMVELGLRDAGMSTLSSTTAGASASATRRREKSSRTRRSSPTE